MDLNKLETSCNDDIAEFKGVDFKQVDIETILRFCKANKSFGEPGITFYELDALDQAMKDFKGKPIIILETGMCYGTTTRYFVVKTLRDGGNFYSCEIQLRDKFVAAMKDLDLWKYIIPLGDSMKVCWCAQIDFLFIDSEHALSNALGEYMRYRIFLKDRGIVGFHDSDCCKGVKEAIEIAQKIDKLELVSETSGKASAGVKFFRLIGRGVVETERNSGRERI